MARRRMIDPAMWDDEDVGSLSDGAFRLFVACVSNADDDGKLEGSPRRLRGIAFAFRDDVTVAMVEGWLDEIAHALRSFVRYQVDSKDYIKLVTWKKWQTIKKPYPSTIPEPVENQWRTSGEPVSAIEEEKRIEEKVIEEKDATAPHPSSSLTIHPAVDHFQDKLCPLGMNRKLKLAIEEAADRFGTDVVIGCIDYAKLKGVNGKGAWNYIVETLVACESEGKLDKFRKRGNSNSQPSKDTSPSADHPSGAITKAYTDEIARQTAARDARIAREKAEREAKGAA